MSVLIILWQSVCKRRKKTWKNVLLRRKNVAELKKHAHFQNRGVNNIVAECVQAQKKTWKTVHVRRKNFAELKKHAHFQNGRVNNIIVAECVQAKK